MKIKGSFKPILDKIEKERKNIHILRIRQKLRVMYYLTKTNPRKYKITFSNNNIYLYEFVTIHNHDYLYKDWQIIETHHFNERILK